jgi:hypothetical protein
MSVDETILWIQKHLGKSLEINNNFNINIGSDFKSSKVDQIDDSNIKIIKIIEEIEECVEPKILLPLDCFKNLDLLKYIDKEEPGLASGTNEMKIVDFRAPESYRVWLIDNSEEPNEIVANILSLYGITPISSWKTFLLRIILFSQKLHFGSRIEVLISLYNEDNHNIIVHGFKNPVSFYLLDIFETLTRHLINDVPPVMIPQIFQLVKIMVKHGYGFNILMQYLSSCHTRDAYKDLIKLEPFMDTDKIIKSLKCITRTFSTESSSRGVILICGYLSALNNYGEEETKSLYEIANNKKNTDNLRADAVDVLLRHGEGEYILKELGGNSNIYENSQNTHAVEYTQIMNYLETVEDKYTVNDVFKGILKLSDNLKIRSILERIKIDRITYSSANNSKTWTTCQALSRVWSHIQHSQHIDTLKVRLIEEIESAYDTCSSGHILRILNSLSGYDGLSLGMSWSDQIAGNFKGRLNAIIKNIKNNDLRSELLCEMVDLGTSNTTPIFNAFIREYLPDITDDIRTEFQHYLPKEIVDELIRSAYSRYSL